jgi:hypothetical protein
MHPMVRLGDEAQVVACLGPFGDCVIVGARQVHGLRQMYHRLRIHFGRTRWNSYVMWVMWNLVLVYLETVSVLVQDRCMVGAKATVGSKIILDAPDGTPR